MSTYNTAVYLNPNWEPPIPNIVLVASYFTTAAYTYSVQITGPGLTKPISFPNNTPGIQKVDLPVSAVTGSMKYNVAITTNSPGLKVVQWSSQIGTKPDGTAMCFMGSIFCNDAGGDLDYNDCVLSLQLFDNSTD